MTFPVFLLEKLVLVSAFTLAANYRIFNSLFASGGSPVVGSNGLEPSTSRLSGARSNHLSYRPVLSGIALRVFGSYSSSPTGGDDGIRTHDPLLAGQVLSQLSYTPIGVFNCFAFQVSPESLQDSP